MKARLVSLALASIALVGAGFLLVPLTPQSAAPLPRARSLKLPPPGLPPASLPLVRKLSLPMPIILPSPELPPPIETAEFQVPEPEGGETYELTLDLARSDSIQRLLADIHVDEKDREHADRTLADLLGERKLATGEQVNLVLQALPEPNTGPRLVSLSVRPRPEREFIITRQAGGLYTGEERVFKLSPRYVRVNATLSSSILEDGTRAGAPAAAVNEFIRALSYEVDFQRELRAGQRFFLLLEQQVTSDGTVANPGRLLAGELVLNARLVSLVRFRPSDGADQFYTLRGESIVRSFLRTPLTAWRITSEFGPRQHPILGYGKMHKGVDFAAPAGTPVLASAAGEVTFADNDGSHGLFVKIDHGSDVATGYAHLARLGPGIAPGATVRQGQLIGFVGSSGRSTGPHLHYEFYRGGKPVDPLKEKLGVRQTLSGKDLERFRAQVRKYVGQFKLAPSVGDGAMVLVPKSAAIPAAVTTATLPPPPAARQAAQSAPPPATAPRKGGYASRKSSNKSGNKSGKKKTR
jgi:murein DD-endopeptidase MepM/ murein hydrolase activator NlpD